MRCTHFCRKYLLFTTTVLLEDKTLLVSKYKAGYAFDAVTHSTCYILRARMPVCYAFHTVQMY